MAFDVLSIIKDEEQKASKLLHEAQQSANDMIKNAESKAIEDERKAAVDHRALFQSILDERKTQVEAQLKTQQTETRAALTAVVQQAQDRVADAAQFIINEVINGHR
ncbi:MAG: hypothetical protein GXZ04_02440 [Clostridiales bacterium]|nr:hypothetical protein [Clostridiales bacterium]